MIFRLTNLVCLLLFMSSSPSFSQENSKVESTVLIINSAMVFENSKLGKDILFTFQNFAKALEKEADVNVKKFEKEELQLTKKRDQLSKKEFNKLADDFDIRVQSTRSLYDMKDSQLNTKMKLWKKNFFEFSGRIIQPIMGGYKAYIVLDVNQVDLIFDNRIDITDQVIVRLNEVYKRNPENLKKITED